MKRFSAYTLSFYLFSCSGVTEEKQIETSTKIETSDTVVDSSTRIPSKDVKSLRGMHFVLGGAMRDGVCVITEACDCCNADLMFLSDTEFIYDDLCEGHYIKKGTYRLKESEIILEFESLLVSSYHNEESESDSTQPKRILKSEYKDSPLEVYKIGYCKGSIMLTNNDTTEDAIFAVGMLKDKAETEKRIQVLKEIGAWELLNITLVN